MIFSEIKIYSFISDLLREKDKIILSNILYFCYLNFLLLIGKFQVLLQIAIFICHRIIFFQDYSMNIIILINSFGNVCCIFSLIQK